MQIQDAINQLKTDLLAGVDAATALSEAAADHSLNPILLHRKFKEQTGSEIEGFAGAAAARQQILASAAQADLEAAKKLALAERAFWRGGEERLAGRDFEFKGDRFVFVVFVGGSARELKAVKVGATPQLWKISGPQTDAIMRQLAA